MIALPRPRGETARQRAVRGAGAKPSVRILRKSAEVGVDHEDGH